MTVVRQLVPATLVAVEAAVEEVVAVAGTGQPVAASRQAAVAGVRTQPVVAVAVAVAVPWRWRHLRQRLVAASCTMPVPSRLNYYCSTAEVGS